ncbi:PPOX class F420-dependent oxidoreductase [Williamsia sterculiae]|uniref:Pyridoxamine 5'-phosphate oxidase N-terminal domain-containing protein n=1 Tax=Williamsia sterculiae TaxID=1344003 RepID=A0A1N7GRL4_9NOCA|nr:PPOX class F420-dependent oxidoreductase [Williamsia sterculiae]SIS15196.1 hypothetical protein SAMN05445060_3034 [Williamsia sterculiae]
MTDNAAATLASATYVQFTTFRKTGLAVGSPVWFTALPDGTFGFTTGATTGKVKRLRNNDKVDLRVCDRRGNVASDAEVFHGTAEVFTEGPRVDEVKSAIKDEYGLLAKLISNPVLDAVRTVVTRGKAQPTAVVVVTLDN